MEKIVINGITITCEDSIIASGVTLKTMVSCKVFTDWLDELDQEHFTVGSVHIQAVNLCSPRVGFMLKFFRS